MEKKIKLLQAAIFDFAELYTIIRSFFEKHNIHVDNIDIGYDEDSTFSISFYDEASHVRFNEKFHEIASSEIMLDKYCIVHFQNEKGLEVLSVIFEKQVVNSFFREYDAMVCVVFGNQ